MDSQRARALLVCRPLIIQNLDPNIVLDYMIANQWFRIEERDVILSEITVQRQCRKFLDMLGVRPSAAFDCFVKALEEEGSFLADALKKYADQPAHTRNRENSLSDLRQTLVGGAVPNVPRFFISRSKLIDDLLRSLKSLANHFRADGPSSGMADLSISVKPTGDMLHQRLHQIPTNAWLLVYGLAGCGKTVLCTTVLRHHFEEMSDSFPGGVVWFQVGRLQLQRQSSTELDDCRGEEDRLILERVSELERRIASLPDSIAGEVDNFQTALTSPTLNSALHRLRITLMRRQQRKTWAPNDSGKLITSLLLVVLDDVWDSRFIRELSTMPAAFLITSRNSEILHSIQTRIEPLHITEDLTRTEVAELLAQYSRLEVTSFLPDSSRPDETVAKASCGDQLLPLACRLTRGLPLAVSLLGDVLATYPYRLPDYICNIGGLAAEPFIDWQKMSRSSAYDYDTVCSALQPSLEQLSRKARKLYQRLVVFDSDVMLTPQVTSILWAVLQEEAENILYEYSRNSLAMLRWSPLSEGVSFVFHPIQLDALKASVDPVRQASYHSQFIQNYARHCSGQWMQLVASRQHAYFWHRAAEHLLKAGQLLQLTDLFTNLDFLRGRLTVMGASPVLADFRRYRPVFATVGRMEEWHAYLQFLQTNAYYLIDPVSVGPSDRSRSIYRGGGSNWSLDSAASSSLSPSRLWPRFCTDGLSAGASPTSGDLTNHPATGKAATINPLSSTTRPKGVDLIQLGLGLPQNNPVFQQSVLLLLNQYLSKIRVCIDGGTGNNSGSGGTRLQQRPAAGHSGIPEYYWFWSNSHVAASQLMWAIPCGLQPVSCLDLETVTPSAAASASAAGIGVSAQVNGEKKLAEVGATATGHCRRRFLAATRSGLLLLLDAASGYEVAVQQIYPEDVEVKLLHFLSGNQRCLTCGSDGSVIVSNLPPAEKLESSTHYVEATDVNHYDLQSDTFYSANTFTFDDHMAGLDVDNMEHTVGQGTTGSPSGDHSQGYLPLAHGPAVSFRSLGHSDNDVPVSSSDDDDPEEENSRHPDSHSCSLDVDPPKGEDLRLSASGTSPWCRRKSASSPTPVSPIFNIPSPIVLADLPQMNEIARVRGYCSSMTNDDTRYTLACIAVSPDLELIVLSGYSDGPARADGTDSVLATIYYLRHTGGNQLHLDCSRELRLPLACLNAQKGDSDESASCPVATTAVAIAISADSQLVTVVLSNGHLWVYSLDSIGWLTCISTHLATQTGATVDTLRKAKRRPADKVLEGEGISLTPGPVPTCCIFLPGAPVTTPVPSEPLTSCFLAAALASEIMVWGLHGWSTSTPEDLMFASNRLAKNSQPAVRLHCSPSCSVLTMDACLIADQCVLAGGTTDGHVLLWRVRDGCKLLELSAHPTWVTCVRILTPEWRATDLQHFYETGGCDTLPTTGLEHLSIGLLTGAANGMVKRWEVGATCLPSPTTPSTANALPLYPQPSSLGLPNLLRGSRLSGRMDSTTGLPNFHGLWTDVFATWFGANGSLLVMGRRRHSADLQFLFRPEQKLNEPTTAQHDDAFKFNEIILRRNQMIYSSTPNYGVPTNASSSEKPAPQSTGRTAPTGVLERASMPTHTVPLYLSVPNRSHSVGAAAAASAGEGGASVRGVAGAKSPRHWVETAGLSFSLHGQVTAVSFWPCGTWAAVGYTTGLVQILSLHFDSSSLSEIVRRFSLVLPPTASGDKSGCQQCNRHVMRVHTWASSSESQPRATGTSTSEPATRIVMAVYSNGCVATWHLVSRDVFEDCPEIEASGYWPCLHNGPATAASQPVAGTKSSSREATPFLSWKVESPVLPPISWSCLRSIHVGNADGGDASKALAAETLVWVTTGYDGCVHARGVDERCTGDVGVTPSLHSDWQMDLVAHPMEAVTDADVDPTGRWLVTTSTDGTAKIWSFESASLLFVTGKHLACVRSVAVRPVVEDALQPEWFVATGDDAGCLRIWHIKAHILQKPSQTYLPKPCLLRHQQRALSPESPPAWLGPAGPPAQGGQPSRRVPSPDVQQQYQQQQASQHRVQSNPEFRSTAAGAGGAWLRELVWSPDGLLLVGLSDRLCVWPFEPVAHKQQLMPVGSGSGSGGAATTLLSRHQAQLHQQHRVTSQLQHHQMHRLHSCRVLQVLSSGVCNAVGPCRNTLMVSRRRQIQANPAAPPSRQIPPSLSRLPSTIVTVDVDIGTLFVFDPIGSLFLSELSG